MPDTDVAVVGAGPTGLMLAAELALAGVRCTVLERRRETPNLTRAFALHARALELLDGRGLAEELIARGNPLRRPRTEYMGELDLSELDTRFPMMLTVPQSGTEHVLERRALELGATIRRGADLTGLEQTPDEVRLTFADGSHLDAAYTVGCDGAHSTVRDLLAVGFTGAAYTVPMVLADVRMPGRDTMAPPMTQASPEGVVVALPFGDGWFRVGYWLADEADTGSEPGFDDLRAVFRRIAGTDHRMASPRWISRFTAHRRQATRYRTGRAFLAGDAVHVNSPIGGQGMNTGLQDAFNLGWKLAADIAGRAPAGLLDSYHRERHPVGERVLALTDRLTRSLVGRSRARVLAERAGLRAVALVGPARRRLLARITGLDVAYPPAEPGAHRLAGRRAPDAATDGGRLYELLRDGRFVLVTPGGPRPWSPAVRAVGGGGPGAVLVRPDGYIAWADGRAEPAGLDAALTHWCGPAGR